jgi:uncharacterized protein YcfJ
MSALIPVAARWQGVPMRHMTYLMLALLAVSLCGAAGADQFQTFAPVINVEPVYETRYEPVRREVCTEPDASLRGYEEIAPSIGEDIRRQARLWQQQRRCRTVTEQHPSEHVTSYRVTYRYNGETETTLLSYDPGKQMRVNVSLSPVR